MKTIITATAPTVYQLNSLIAFGMGYTASKSGSYSASMEFDSEKDAKEYLSRRAQQYNSEDPNGSDERLADMVDDIQNYNQLTLDAVTARIEEVEELKLKNPHL